MPWDLLADYLEKSSKGQWWLKPLLGGVLVSLVVGFAFGSSVGWETLFRGEFIRWINFSFLLGVSITGFGMSLTAFRSPTIKARSRVWIALGILVQGAILLALGIWAIFEIVEIESGQRTEQAQALNPKTPRVEATFLISTSTPRSRCALCQG